MDKTEYYVLNQENGADENVKPVKKGNQERINQTKDIGVEKTNEKDTKRARNENNNPDRNYQVPTLQYPKMDFGDKPDGKTIKKAVNY